MTRETGLGLQRSKYEIRQAVLSALDAEKEALGITELGRRARLSHVTTQAYLDELQELDMIVFTDKGYLITSKGREYLKSFERLQKLLSGVGAQ